MKIFNINQEVLIKLNEEGFQHLVDEYNKYLIYDYSHSIEAVDIDYFKSKCDENGYYPIQLWELMHHFGKVMFNGCKLLFETNIKIKEEDLKDEE